MRMRPTIAASSRSGSSLPGIVFNILLACLWYTYYKACSADPGRYAFPSVSPNNPFLTAEYALARQRVGDSPVVLEQGTELCLAFLRRGRVTSSLEVTSLPFAPSSAFLTGLVEFCKDRRIYEAALQLLENAKTYPWADHARGISYAPGSGMTLTLP